MNYLYTNIKDPHHVVFNNVTYKAIYGRNGFIKADQKREGDQCTPCGCYRVLYGYYRADRISPFVSKISLYPLQQDVGWCDDPKSPSYNQEVRLPHNYSFENLWREDHLYDLILVTSHNYDPVIAHAGSAVFIHTTNSDDDEKESAGCMKLGIKDFISILTTCEADLTWVIE